MFVGSRSWCYKTFFGGNLYFPKIKKLNNICSDDWTCAKTLRQCYFLLNYFKHCISAQKWSFLVVSAWGKSRFSRFPPKKFKTSTTGLVFRIKTYVDIICYIRYKYVVEQEVCVTLGDPGSNPFIGTFYWESLLADGHKQK